MVGPMDIVNLKYFLSERGFNRHCLNQEVANFFYFETLLAETLCFKDFRKPRKTEKNYKL